jgi:hypothetical protein
VGSRERESGEAEYTMIRLSILVAALISIVVGIALIVDEDLVLDSWPARLVGIFLGVLALVSLGWFLVLLASGIGEGAFWSSLFVYGFPVGFVVYGGAAGGYALLVGDRGFFERTAGGLTYSLNLAIGLLVYSAILVWVALKARW